ncbi:MAG: DNA-processing protein DprA [bacterium]|nr:DNA-processing protein DprA [bacterium]
MDNEETLYWLAFSTVIGIGPKRFSLLRDYFSSAKKAWEADESKIIPLGLPAPVLKEFLNQRKTFNPEIFPAVLEKKAIKFATTKDADYPKLLKEIPDPPFIIFWRGDIEVSKKPAIAVVGTRKMTPYGREVTEILTRDLTGAGLIIVSGLARGVDGIAHKTCLDNNGKTIAVLGAGVDIVYPPDHGWLYREILEKGSLIISEVPPGKFVAKGIFPARNRIVSGLSLGVLVTEGAEDSGSLITARLALEQGREVFAVPGPITSALSAGPMKLLKEGAKLVNAASDILEELNLGTKSLMSSILAEEIKGDDDHEERILTILRIHEAHFDEIVRETGFEAEIVGATVSIMEIKGKIKEMGNMIYRIKT